MTAGVEPGLVGAEVGSGLSRDCDHTGGNHEGSTSGSAGSGSGRPGSGGTCWALRNFGSNPVTRIAVANRLIRTRRLLVLFIRLLPSEQPVTIAVRQGTGDLEKMSGDHHCTAARIASSIGHCRE